MAQPHENDNLILISGKSATGKSASLRNLKDPDGVMYLNCETNKKLPFRSKFKEYTITDPMDVYNAFTAAENKPDVHTLIVDSLTFLMDMYESVYVLTSTNTMKAWGEYAQYLKKLMAQYVAVSSKNVIFIAHTMDVMNDVEMVNETFVKVKGSLMNNGVESFFSTVISSKKMSLKKLTEQNAKSKLIHVSDDEDMLGFKYVYQTRLTKETVTERIRSPMLMWEPKETFIDNDLQQVIERLHDYYQ